MPRHQAVDVLSPLKINGEDKSLLQNDVPVFTIHRQILACAPKREATDFEIIKNTKAH